MVLRYDAKTGHIPKIPRIPPAGGCRVTLDELRTAVFALPRESVLSLSAGALQDALAAVQASTTPQAEEAERWLTAEEVGERLNVSPRWAYDHIAALGGRRLSRKCVRFSSTAVAKYLTRRRA